MEANSVRNMSSIIAVTNKHTTKLHHVGSLYILTYNARKIKHKINRGVRMYQRTSPHSPNGQINANLTAGPIDYEAGYFPVEFYFSSVNR
jgi:hypothetical protein